MASGGTRSLNFCHLVFTVQAQNLLTLQKRKAWRKKKNTLPSCCCCCCCSDDKDEEVKNVNGIRRGVNDVANCLPASLASLHQLQPSLVSALRQSSAYLITVSECRFLNTGNHSRHLLGRRRGWRAAFLIRITTILKLHAGP